eukprot:2342286-Prymnesium_polylepis.2
MEGQHRVSWSTTHPNIDRAHEVTWEPSHPPPPRGSRSIPQRNSVLQTLSIDSLPLYAANSALFITIAPHVTNSLGVHFDFATYRSRGWCRLEMLAR